MLRDYAALNLVEPSKDRLTGYVTEYFDGAEAARLSALVDAMSETEVAEVFGGIANNLQTTTYKFVTMIDLWPETPTMVAP